MLYSANCFKYSVTTQRIHHFPKKHCYFVLNRSHISILLGSCSCITLLTAIHSLATQSVRNNSVSGQKPKHVKKLH